jgi:hypothetical protein
MVSPAEQRAQRLEVIRPLLEQASELRARFEKQAATGPAAEQPYWLASARLQIDHSNDLKAMARGTSLLRTLPTTTAIEPPVVDPLLDALTDVELAALGGPWSQTGAAAAAHVRTALEVRAAALTAATGKAATSRYFTELLDAAYQRAGHAPGAWAREPICAQDAENSLADQVNLVGEQARYDAAIATLELVTAHARAIRDVSTAHEAATRGSRWSLRRQPAPEPVVYPSFRSAWPTLTAVLDGHTWAYHEYLEAAGTP